MASNNPTYSADDASQGGYFTLSLSVDVNDNGVTTSSEPEEFRFTFETFVTLFTTLVCVVGNSLILIVAARTTAFDNFNRCYLFSLTTSDLFLGLFITPFSMFNSMYDKWVFNSDIFCCVEAYLLALFVMVSMISMAFIVVDHYVAVRKPDRYNVMMSFNRSLCWIVLTWVIATSFCCPPLFSLQRAIYYSQAYICVIDQEQQQTYFMTVTFMVTLPTVVAVIITSRYLFTSAFKDQKMFYQRVYEYFSERSWNYYISFVVTAMFFITWMPFTFVRVVISMKGWSIDDVPREIHFYCVWFGLSNCFTKFIVYIFMSPQFRQGLREICEIPEHQQYAVCAGCGSESSMESFDPDVITVPPPRK